MPWNENTIQITSLGYLHMMKVTNMYPCSWWDVCVGNYATKVTPIKHLIG